jgi:hypothetical protein
MRKAAFRCAATNPPLAKMLRGFYAPILARLVLRV